MSVRRLNYTGRKRIRRESVQIGTNGTPPGARVGATFHFADYNFPPTARVVLEAQAGWTVQRFEFGTVGDYREPADTRLIEFDSLDGIMFRVKVVATGDHEGKLLGAADGIRPSALLEDARQQSFVVVRSAELGQRTWRMDFDENQPLLLINSTVGDHNDFLRRSEVAALILPEVLSVLLTKAIEYGEDEEREDAWPSMAHRLGEALTARPAPSENDEEEVERWIEEAVDSFARRHRLLDKVEVWIGGDD